MKEISFEMVKDLVQVIDVVAKRGAINGNEMEGVGKLRTALLDLAEDEIKTEIEAQKTAAEEAEAVEDTLPESE